MRKCIFFGWQEPSCVIRAFSDSDWGGCIRTRKSTSGGVLFNGDHMVKHWSKLQSGVALSSGEAELYACNKSATESLVFKQLCVDLGDNKSIHCHVDASACKGMVMREGAGKAKHIDVAELWLQEKITEGRLVVHKVARERNCSDALTHYWTIKDSESHFNCMNLFHL